MTRPRTRSVPPRPIRPAATDPPGRDGLHDHCSVGGTRYDGARAPVAQWTERGRPKACVGGSSPSGGATGRLKIRAVLVLVEAFKAPDPTVRLSVARSLVRLGGPRAITALKKMRSDSNPNVRVTALNGLLELGETD